MKHKTRSQATRTDRESTSSSSSNQDSPAPKAIKMTKPDVTLAAIWEELQSIKGKLDLISKDTMERMDSIEDRMEKLEVDSRRSNLIIRGIQDEDKESAIQLENKVLKFLRDDLKCPNPESMIDNCYRLGKYRIPTTPLWKGRSILLKLTREKYKRDIFSSTRNLKGTSYGIESDLPESARKKKSLLLRKRREAIDAGKVA